MFSLLIVCVVRLCSQTSKSTLCSNACMTCSKFLGRPSLWTALVMSRTSLGSMFTAALGTRAFSFPVQPPALGLSNTVPPAPNPSSLPSKPEPKAPKVPVSTSDLLEFLSSYLRNDHCMLQNVREDRLWGPVVFDLIVNTSAEDLKNMFGLTVCQASNLKYGVKSLRWLINNNNYFILLSFETEDVYRLSLIASTFYTGGVR